MTNRGVAPYDVSTSTGQFRVFYGDTEYTELFPAETGYGDYTELSDVEIGVYLAKTGDSVSRAIGYYLTTLANQASLRSKSIADYDLKVDLTKRAQDLRDQAQTWFDLADSEDDASGDNDVFASYEFGGTQGDIEVPELAPPIVLEW